MGVSNALCGCFSCLISLLGDDSIMTILLINTHKNK